LFRVEQPRITPVDATLRIKPEQPDEVHVDDLVVQVAVLVEDDGAKTETMSDETAERMARTLTSIRSVRDEPSIVRETGFGDAWHP
jgi:hypothetical protein